MARKATIAVATRLGFMSESVELGGRAHGGAPGGGLSVGIEP